MVAAAPANSALTLTAAQIAWFAQQAGFTGNAVATATAIALAESGGKTAVVSPANSNGSHDYGLWQINDNAHPDLLTADAQWWVAGFNAQMAFKIYTGSGNTFNAWSTFKNGAYLVHMPAAQLAATNPESSGTVQAGPNTTYSELAGPLGGIAEGAKALGSFAFKMMAWGASPANWSRVAFVAIGGGLVIGALMITARPAVMGAAAPVLNAAATVAPGGGAIKKAASVAAKGAKK
jgi:hypothetical protein